MLLYNNIIIIFEYFYCFTDKEFYVVWHVIYVITDIVNN